jgi:hypothetical protein
MSMPAERLPAVLGVEEERVGVAEAEIAVRADAVAAADARQVVEGDGGAILGVGVVGGEAQGEHALLVEDRDVLLDERREPREVVGAPVTDRRSA